MTQDRKEYQRQYRERNKLRLKEYHEEYRKQHKAELREYKRIWNANNKDKVRNYQSNYWRRVLSDEKKG